MKLLTMIHRATALSIAVALGLSPASAQTGRPAPAEVVVVARVEAVESVPACGVLHVSPVVRHTVLRVERGHLPPGALYAFYSCGWTSAQTSVRPGAALRLSLTRRPRRSFGSTIDTMGDRGVPRFYVERAERP